jgi:hypothetical protein
MGNLRRLQRRQQLQASRRRAVRGRAVAPFKALPCEGCGSRAETHCHAFLVVGMHLCEACHALLHYFQGADAAGSTSQLARSESEVTR